MGPQNTRGLGSERSSQVFVSSRCLSNSVYESWSVDRTGYVPAVVLITLWTRTQKPYFLVLQRSHEVSSLRLTQVSVITEHLLCWALCGTHKTPSLLKAQCLYFKDSELDLNSAVGSLFWQVEDQGI